MGDSYNEDQCKIDVGGMEKYREEIPAIVEPNSYFPVNTKNVSIT